MIVAAALLCCVLAACTSNTPATQSPTGTPSGSSAEPTTGSAEPTTGSADPTAALDEVCARAAEEESGPVTWWHTLDNEDSLPTLVEQFSAKYPGIEIEGLPGLNPDEQVQRIITEATAGGEITADIAAPPTAWMASLSLQYTAAVALLEGAVGLEHFAPPHLESAAIRTVMEKVSVVVDPDLAAAFPGRWSCRVEIVGDDGIHETERVDSARGDPRNPMSATEVRLKFHTLDDRVLGRAAAERICA